MKDYLKNIIPRIIEYSTKVDKIEKFIDKPWIFITKEGKKEKYIFRRNNELLISKEGNITKGKWEFLDFDNSLIIEGEDFNLLLNQGFIFKEIMILRKDGSSEDLFPLVNELAIGNLGIQEYLDSKIKQIENATDKRLTKRGEELKEHLSYEKLKIKLIAKLPYYQTATTSSGDMFKIVTKRKYHISLNDEIFFDGLPAPDGKYLLNKYHLLVVKNGRII